MHTITDEGREIVRQWSMKQPRMPAIKDDLLLKFYAFEDIDMKAMIEHVSHRIEQHETRLLRYEKIKMRHYDEQDLTMTKMGKLFALEMGIENERAQIKMLTTTLVKMKGLG